MLAVPASNPANINGIADLANAQRVLVGDPESTPIGKIAKKALTDAGLWDSLMNAGVITTTTTAPQIATALANGEGDAGIVWKENVKGDGVSIVDTTDLDGLVRVIPAAQLDERPGCRRRQRLQGVPADRRRLGYLGLLRVRARLAPDNGLLSRSRHVPYGRETQTRRTHTEALPPRSPSSSQ